MTTPFHPLLTGLTCFDCGTAHAHTASQTVCTSCGMPLRVDLDLAQGTDPADLIDSSIQSMWRYGGALPLTIEASVSLVEGWTPLIDIGDGVLVKDEARNPTGSFKARGMSMAVSAASAHGAQRLVTPSAGNAAGALSAYGASAGLPVLVAMPEDTPRAFVDECQHYGADVQLVPGTIADAGRWLAEHRSPADFDLSTLKEPYRIEGKKTMGYELYEQTGGRLPEVIIYPTGGGTGLVGMWKAFDEMEAMGWIGPTRPRFVSVQAEGCAPVVSAFHAGDDRTDAWLQPHTSAYGLRVPSPIGGFICLRALRETHGTGVSIPEPDIAPAAADLAATTGIDICPEGGAAWAAYRRLRNDGWVKDGERVVVFNTGTGLKYR